MELPVASPTLPIGPEAAAASFFISGTLHRPFRLGQKITTEDINEEMEDAALMVGRKFGGGARKSTPGGGGLGAGPGSGFRGSVSLADLVESGILVAGRGKITCSYKGQTVGATLTPDGCIEYHGKRYQSATAFSIFFKRTITPSKQGDDGWKSVLYDGKPLEHYRKVLQEQKRARGEVSGAATPVAGVSLGGAAHGGEQGPSSALGGPLEGMQLAGDVDGQGRVGAAEQPLKSTGKGRRGRPRGS